MLSASTPEPDPSGAIIYVGQDTAGHWLVQLSSKQMEGRFVSFAAAMSYARSERSVYHAAVEICAAPLQPLVSFAPVAADERAAARRLTERIVKSNRVIRDVVSVCG